MKKPTLFRIWKERLSYYLYRKELYQKFAEKMPLGKEANILDFGCKTGEMSLTVLKTDFRVNLTCFEKDHRWLKACRRTLHKYPNVVFTETLSEIEARKPFDLIYCHMAISGLSQEEVETISAFLCDSLNKGGIIVFRESMKEIEKVIKAKLIFYQKKMRLTQSSISDLPVLGTVIECVYQK
ncbi:MAG: methyltransferase domain-containing protein [Acholeplasmataceae bacterium]|nr:methyltransferase domain-containing protein [Acholeplasmataceae bacterium]